MASRLELNFKGSDPWIVAVDTFNIIAAYLQPDSSASAPETATNLNALTPMERPLAEGERAEEPGSFLLEFWEMFIALVQQIPHDHPSQERLVQLVKELKSLIPESAAVSIILSHLTPMPFPYS